MRMISTLIITAALFGCLPNGKLPNLNTIEQIVATDLEAGKTPEQIEGDIAAIIGGNTAEDVVKIVNDVIVLLVDMNTIPASAIPHARSVLAAERLKLTK